MARNTRTNVKSVVITIDREADIIADIRFNDTELTRKFRNVRVDVPWATNRMRTSYALGLAYFVADAADRKELVIAYGHSAIRHGLLMATRRATDKATVKSLKDEAATLVEEKAVAA